MKSFLESLAVYFVIGAAGVFCAIVLGFLALGEGNPATAIMALLGIVVLLILQGASKPLKSALFGAAIGTAWGVVIGAWFTGGFMQDSIMFVENYATPGDEILVGGVVLSVICLILGWSAYGVSALVRRRRSGAVELAVSSESKRSLD